MASIWQGTRAHSQGVTLGIRLMKTGHYPRDLMLQKLEALLVRADILRAAQRRFNETTTAEQAEQAR